MLYTRMRCNVCQTTYEFDDGPHSVSYIQKIKSSCCKAPMSPVLDETSQRETKKDFTAEKLQELKPAVISTLFVLGLLLVGVFNLFWGNP